MNKENIDYKIKNRIKSIITSNSVEDNVKVERLMAVMNEQNLDKDQTIALQQRIIELMADNIEFRIAPPKIEPDKQELSAEDVKEAICG